MAKYRNEWELLILRLKALCDEGRLRAYLALAQGELCVCQITALLKLAPSTVSKHMAVLKQAGLVDGRKAGRWNYYRLSAAGPELLEAIKKMLKGDPSVQADAAYLKVIVKQDPQKLCKSQCRS